MTMNFMMNLKTTLLTTLTFLYLITIKLEIELRGDLWLLYTTCVVGWTVYVVSTFPTNSSMEYRRYVNRFFDTIVYETEGEESDSDSDSDESDSEEPDEASEEEEEEKYDIPEPDYNESNLMEGIDGTNDYNSTFVFI